MNCDNFKTFELKDKKIIEEYIFSSNNSFSHYNFTNLFCWQNYYKSYWQIHKDKLYIYHDQCKSLQIPPDENITVQELYDISKKMKKNKMVYQIGICSKEFIDKNREELERYFKILTSPEDNDYIYTREKLLFLKGRKLHKKRNLIKQFLKENGEYKGLVLTQANKSQCYELADKWQYNKEGNSLKESPEYEALNMIFKHCNILNIKTYGIFIKGNLEAFSISSRQNKDTASVHFEKYNSKIKGLSQIINRDTAKSLENYKYINREQDLGIESLRRAKESYLPDIVLKAYTLILK